METGLCSFRSPFDQEEGEMEDFDGISKVPCNRSGMVRIGPRMKRRFCILPSLLRSLCLMNTSPSL